MIMMAILRPFIGCIAWPAGFSDAFDSIVVRDFSIQEVYLYLIVQTRDALDNPPRRYFGLIQIGSSAGLDINTKGDRLSKSKAPQNWPEKFFTLFDLTGTLTPLYYMHFMSDTRALLGRGNIRAPYLELLSLVGFKTSVRYLEAPFSMIAVQKWIFIRQNLWLNLRD